MRDRRSRARLVTAGTGALLLVSSVLMLAIHGTSATTAERPRVGTGCAASGPSPAAGCSGGVPEPTLRSLARGRGLVIGSAASAEALAQDPQYATVLGSQFGAVTPEDAMKWSRVEPRPGQYDWAGADRVVDFARRNNQQVYGHALVWYTSLPGWLETGGRSDPEIAALMRQHITDEVARYRGKVWAWDVVNEPLGAGGKPRASLWSRALGPDYIAEAFRAAHAADPGAKLFLNEFGADGINAKSDALYKLVRRLLSEGVPIHGVGFQSHLNLEPAPAHRVDNLRRFTALGIDVAITEADVRIVGPSTPAKLKAQAEVYRQTIKTCLAVARCVSFTVWGFTDRYSWIPNVQADAGAACLYDAELVPKPAYAAVAGALVTTPEPSHS